MWITFDTEMKIALMGLSISTRTQKGYVYDYYNLYDPYVASTM